MVKADLDNIIKPLTHLEFNRLFAEGKYPKLINDHHASISEFVHPLTFSMKVKKHPDMLAIPVAYKFHRNFYKLYKEMKKMS